MTGAIQRDEAIIGVSPNTEDESNFSIVPSAGY